MKRTPLRRRRKARPDLDAAREVVRARAAGRCEALGPVCDGFGGWYYHGEAHHILRRSQGGKDDASNLLWVCPPCHRYIHANPSESFDRGWLHHIGGSSHDR